MEFSINSILDDNEKIIWQGKPNYKRTMRTIYYLMIYIVALVLCVSLPFIGMSLVWFFIIFAVCGTAISVYMPIAGKNSIKNKLYVFTDKRIIVQSGVHSIIHNSIDYSMIFDISVRIGVIDKRYGTGDIMLRGNVRQVGILTHIDKPYDIFKMIKKICDDKRVN